MFKKSFGFAALVFSLSSTSPNLSYAEDLSQLENDFSKSAYSDLVEEGVVDKSLSYNSWVDANTEDSFEELEKEFPVPNKLMEVEPESKTAKGYSVPSKTFSTMAAASKGPALKKEISWLVMVHLLMG